MIQSLPAVSVSWQRLRSLPAAAKYHRRLLSTGDSNEEEESWEKLEAASEEGDSGVVSEVVSGVVSADTSTAATTPKVSSVDWGTNGTTYCCLGSGVV